MLNRYNSELNDLSDNINISLDLDGFSGAMDYIFDNFFTDYIIQDKIKSALRSTKVLRYKVSDIQNNLTAQLQCTEIEINSLKKNLEEAIISETNNLIWGYGIKNKYFNILMIKFLN